LHYFLFAREVNCITWEQNRITQICKTSHNKIHFPLEHLKIKTDTCVDTTTRWLDIYLIRTGANIPPRQSFLDSVPILNCTITQLRRTFTGAELLGIHFVGDLSFLGGCYQLTRRDNKLKGPKISLVKSVSSAPSSARVSRRQINLLDSVKEPFSLKIFGKKRRRQNYIIKLVINSMVFD